jgi:hypothetical protein
VSSSTQWSSRSRFASPFGAPFAAATHDRVSRVVGDPVDAEQPTRHDSMSRLRRRGGVRSAASRLPSLP